MKVIVHNYLPKRTRDAKYSVGQKVRVKGYGSGKIGEVLGGGSYEVFLDSGDDVTTSESQIATSGSDPKPKYKVGQRVKKSGVIGTISGVSTGRGEIRYDLDMSSGGEINDVRESSITPA